MVVELLIHAAAELIAELRHFYNQKNNPTQTFFKRALNVSPIDYENIFSSSGDRFDGSVIFGLFVFNVGQ